MADPALEPAPAMSATPEISAPTSLDPSHPKGFKSTYGQILKSSVLMGGSSAMNVACGIVRAKAMAVLLGPAGVGMLGLYGSILDLAQSMSCAGLTSAGVRQIAEASGSGDLVRAARIAKILQRMSFALGVASALCLLILATPISHWTFNSADFALPVSLLSLAVLFRSIAAGQEALIQGLRRITDLARCGVLTALFGTTASLILIFILREKGVVPALISVSVATLGATWWYRRKIQLPDAPITMSQIRTESLALAKLASAFLISSFLTIGAIYAIRVIVTQKVGLDAAGMYFSAWALGGQYVGFILQAMGSDFYPRLTAVAMNHPEANRLVNEQAEVGMLLAGPGVLATLTFSPFVIALFYTHQFAAAVDPLRWICLGMMLRVVAWPLGFIVLAKGAQKLFICLEVVIAVIHVGFAFLAVAYFGMKGAGIAFFGLYFIYTFIIRGVVHTLTGFTWSRANIRIGALTFPLIGAVFCCVTYLPFWPAIALGTTAVAFSSFYSMRTLLTLIPLDRLPRTIRRVATYFYRASTRTPIR